MTQRKRWHKITLTSFVIMVSTISLYLGYISSSEWVTVNIAMGTGFLATNIGEHIINLKNGKGKP